MYIDYDLLLHNAVIVDGAQASASYIDTLAAGDALSPNAYLLITCTAAMTGMTTVEFWLRTDSDPAFGTEVNLIDTGTVGYATLTLGKSYLIPIPVGVKRYLRGYITTAGGAYTAGAVYMAIVLMGDKTLDKVL
jgi:hypothetical protein